MSFKRRRAALLYSVGAIAFGTSLHAFITEGMGISGVVAGLLAIPLMLRATFPNSRSQVSEIRLARPGCLDRRWDRKAQ